MSAFGGLERRVDPGRENGLSLVLLLGLIAVQALQVVVIAPTATWSVVELENTRLANLVQGAGARLAAGIALGLRATRFAAVLRVELLVWVVGLRLRVMYHLGLRVVHGGLVHGVVCRILLVHNLHLLEKLCKHRRILLVDFKHLLRGGKFRGQRTRFLETLVLLGVVLWLRSGDERLLLLVLRMRGKDHLVRVSRALLSLP